MSTSNKYDFINWVHTVVGLRDRNWEVERASAAALDAKVSEVAMQSRAFINLWNRRPDLRGQFFSINNNAENAIKGALNRAMGVLAGVSDMCLLGSQGLVIWVEWKKVGGYQSQDQKDWAAKCEQLGHLYIIVRNEAEFLTVANFYL